MGEVVGALAHYERLIEEGDDPFWDPPAVQRYMARWDGPAFWEAMGDLAGRAVLEVGVGTGRLARQVLDKGAARFTGIDLSPATIARARENLGRRRGVTLRVADSCTYHCPDAFDVAYSVLTFMHVEDKATALAHIVEALRPGGRVVLSLAATGEWLDYGSRRVRLYPNEVGEAAAHLAGLGCRVAPEMPLVDEGGAHVATLVWAERTGPLCRERRG